MVAVKIEPARFGMTGQGIGAPVRFTHMDEEHGGPLDAPIFIAMGGMQSGRSDPDYIATTTLRPGVFDAKVAT